MHYYNNNFFTDRQSKVHIFSPMELSLNPHTLTSAKP